MAITAIEPGMSLAHSVVPSSGSTAMSTFGPVAVADLLADEEHRRLVALAFADHHRAVDLELVQLAPHGIDRGLVGGLLVATPAQPRGSDRGALGHAHQFERQDALDDVFASDRDGLAHGRLSSSFRSSRDPSELLALDTDHLRWLGDVPVGRHRVERPRMALSLVA